jgi:hypothetical protein
LLTNEIRNKMIEKSGAADHQSTCGRWLMKGMDSQRVSKSATFQTPSRAAVDILNSILEPSNPRQVSEPQILLILDALAGAQDPSLVARFPAVLALCAQLNIELNSQTLLGRYWESSVKRQNLEKLLFVSAELFRRLQIPAPRALFQIAESLRNRLAELSSANEIQLAGGPCVAMSDLAAALTHIAGSDAPAAERAETSPAAEGRRSLWSPNLSALLDLLFPEKQKELVFKKLQKQPMTKTEREYYSRVVKKKLAAIGNPELQEVAALLSAPGSRASADAPGR